MHKSKMGKAQSKPVYKKFEQIYGGDLYETLNDLFEVPGEKRGKSPFEVEEAISREIGGNFNRISGSGRAGFMVEVNSKQQAERVKNVVRKRVPGVAHQFFNGSKGLLFLNNCNTEHLGMMQVNLMQE